MRDLVLAAAGALIGFSDVWVFSMPDKGSSMLLAAIAGVGQDCSIKGNVSIESGERIYHVPGQKYYSATKIDARFGERWFCSETEARQAGWRKSGV